MNKVVLESDYVIPNNSVLTNIEELLKTLESGSRPKGGVKDIKKGIVSIGAEHLTYNGDFKFKKIKFIPTEFYDSMTTGHIQKNDILIVKDGATIGKTSYIPINFPHKKSAVNEHVYIIRAFEDFILSKFLFYFFRSPFAQQLIKTKITGSAQGGINTSFVKNFPIILPPLNEQKRIIEKIEETLVKIDYVKITLGKIKLQLKQYRQSLFKSAFEGKLTEQWRRENIDDSEFELDILRTLKAEIQGIDSKLILETPENISKLHKIPKKWIWVRLGFLSKLITKGASPKWQGVEYVDEGLLFITSENVGFGEILLKKPKFLEKKFNDIQKRSILQKGDILTNIVGASIGRTAIYDLDDMANINQAVSIIRTHDKVNKKYIQHILNSPFILNYMNVEKVDFARANLSLQNVADFPIPLPSLKEQEQIISKIELGFSLINNIENITNSMIKQLDSLRSTILKQAFEGKLVPQDPNDEPVEILPQKIKQEKQQLIQKQKASRSTKNVK